MDLSIERLKAAQWAAETLKKDFLIVDTETTDKTPATCEIVQISIIDKLGQTLFTSLVKPEGKISPQSIDVHHKTEELLADAPSWNLVYNQIKGVVENHLLIAYNEWFDHGVVDHVNSLHHLDPFNCTWDCAMKPFAQFYGEWDERRKLFRFKKLVDAITYFNLEVENAHDALGDVCMTLKVIKKMAEYYYASQLKLT
jgi:DNA polymerase III epsilon subunit-like protein